MADDRAVFIQDRNYLCFINNCIFVRGGIILPVYSFEVVLEFQNDLFAGLYFSFQVFVDIPIYDSISKVNYYSTYTAEELREAQRAKIIDSKVMALGGINEDNLLEIKDFGFGGAVVLGDLWNRFDACQDQNYLAVIEHFKKLKKLSD